MRRDLVCRFEILDGIASDVNAAFLKYYAYILNIMPSLPYKKDFPSVVLTVLTQVYTQAEHFNMKTLREPLLAHLREEPEYFHCALLSHTSYLVDNPSVYILAMSNFSTMDRKA